MEQSNFEVLRQKIRLNGDQISLLRDHRAAYVLFTYTDTSPQIATCTRRAEAYRLYFEVARDWDNEQRVDPDPLPEDQRTAQCWNGFCIISYCDGAHHSDRTGHGWQQNRETIYDPETGRYLPPEKIRHPSPVVTVYERHPETD